MAKKSLYVYFGLKIAFISKKHLVFSHLNVNFAL